MQSTMRKLEPPSVFDSNNNFSITRDNSFNGSNASLISRPRTPKKEQKKVNSQSTPFALDFLNSLRRENSLPFRFSGVDLVDTVRTNYPFIYRINDGVSNNTVLQQVCEERGWVEFRDPTELSQRERDIHDSVGWHFWWSYNFYQSSPFRTLKLWQYTNHNPRAFQFCNKSYLTSFLRRMLHEYGEAFDYVPKGFIMPEDYIRFVTEHLRRQQPNLSAADCRNVITVPTVIPTPEDPSSPPSSRIGTAQKKGATRGTKSPVWITKPVGKSQGKGIYLTTDAGVIANESRSVVQEYISRPFLIGGYKWDIRIYVCVASTDPLVIYMYREGLCRFATEKYNLGNLEANFSHLTNASLNKLGPDYPTEKDVVGSGCKWSLRQLRKHLKDREICDWFIWQKIMSMVVLTVVGEALRSGFSFPANKNCFDFFGFDILLDEKLRPWLLEVNYSPGLGGDCNVDEIVKKPMLHSLFDLLRFPDKSDKPKFSSKSVVNSQAAAFKSKLMVDIDKYLRRPMPVELVTKPVDCSCKARLKEAAAIYSQDLVAELIVKYSKNPHFKMTKSMKAILDKKISDKNKKRSLQSIKVAKTYLKPEAIQVSTSPPPSTPDENGNDINLSNSDDETVSNATAQFDGESPVTVENSAQRPTSASSSTGKSSPKENTDGSSYLYIKRQDWLNPPKTSGDWVLVYPCKAYPYQSPYRSSLSDLRGIVKTVDNYLQIARFVSKTYPGNTDEFYKEKMKTLCRWDIELWCPPEEPVEENENVVEDLQ